VSSRDPPDPPPWIAGWIVIFIDANGVNHQHSSDPLDPLEKELRYAREHIRLVFFRITLTEGVSFSFLMHFPADRVDRNYLTSNSLLICNLTRSTMRSTTVYRWISSPRIGRYLRAPYPAPVPVTRSGFPYQDRQHEVLTWRI
jgi:hypothetical protein